MDLHRPKTSPAFHTMASILAIHGRGCRMEDLQTTRQWAMEALAFKSPARSHGRAIWLQGIRHERVFDQATVADLGQCLPAPTQKPPKLDIDLSAPHASFEQDADPLGHTLAVLAATWTDDVNTLLKHLGVAASLHAQRKLIRAGAVPQIRRRSIAEAATERREENEAMVQRARAAMAAQKSGPNDDLGVGGCLLTPPNNLNEQWFFPSFQPAFVADHTPSSR